ncbi:MAG: hypothetical protein IKL65_02490 [Bacilli bacterium]|nr:hypothetical protein [Bacilli bacterium]
MKKQTVEAHLTIKNGQPIVTVKGREGQTDSDTLIAYLKKGVSSGEMKVCTPTSEKGYTTYKFKVYDELENLNNYFVIKVKNNERYLHRATIEQIKEITGVSNLIKKLNVNRFVAGIAVSAILLTVAGPSMAKGLGKLIEKDIEYDQQRYHQHTYSSPYIPTEEERTQSEILYYQDLERRALAGDEEALEEYSIYIAQQQLKEQAKEEQASRRK